MDPQKTEYTGFGLRFIAFAIDTVLISLCWVIFSFALMFTPISLFQTLLIYYPFLILVDAIYEISLTTMYGGTIGKLLMRVKVVSEDNKSIGLKESAIRYFMKYVSAVIVGIGFLMIFWEKFSSYLFYVVARYAPMNKLRILCLRKIRYIHIGRDCYIGPTITLTPIGGDIFEGKYDKAVKFLSLRGPIWEDLPASRGVNSGVLGVTRASMSRRATPKQEERSSSIPDRSRLFSLMETGSEGGKIYFLIIVLPSHVSVKRNAFVNHAPVFVSNPISSGLSLADGSADALFLDTLRSTR
ncbi:MAG: RDD family protein [Nanoarchaeota archaeon]|nr:RDD family protein [Nanoarchaeota archaeon]